VCVRERDKEEKYRMATKNMFRNSKDAFLVILRDESSITGTIVRTYFESHEIPISYESLPEYSEQSLHHNHHPSWTWQFRLYDLYTFIES
jgi:hypothetical protein